MCHGGWRGAPGHSPHVSRFLSAGAGRAATWTMLRLGLVSWPALAFAGGKLAGVGAGASREEALSCPATRMAAAGELGTRDAR